jgi:hypothetical protein
MLLVFDSFCAWLLNLHKPWLLIRPPRFQTFLDEHWGYWGEHPAPMSYSQFCRDVTTFICLCFFVFFVRDLGSSWAFCSMRHRRGDLILSSDPGDPIRTLIKIEHIWRVLISSDYMVLLVLFYIYIFVQTYFIQPRLILILLILVQQQHLRIFSNIEIPKNFAVTEPSSPVLHRSFLPKVPHHVFLNPGNPFTAKYVTKNGIWEPATGLQEVHATSYNILLVGARSLMMIAWTSDKSAHPATSWSWQFCEGLPLHNLIHLPNHQWHLQ